VQGGKALRARLPVPEHDEPLSANAAVSFSISFGCFTKYLHLRTS
jgi:hypothetical protein